METQRQQEQEQNQPPDEQILQALIDHGDGDGDGIPVVRTNTPRPLSFARSSSASALAQTSTSESLPSATDFPVEAPTAPPLPEEPEEGQHSASTATRAAPEKGASERAGHADESAPEFIWLFEYGLEMDEGYLNSPDRLNGQAHPYGPAALKGYRIEGIRLRTGYMACTLARDAAPECEVWGVLYRIPRKLTEPRGSELSLLDTAHAAHVYRAVPVVVQEMYRRRAVQCVTYVACETERNDGIAMPLARQFDSSYTRRLLQVARQQRLPEGYLQALAAATGVGAEEQNTEPLPVLPASSQGGDKPAPLPYSVVPGHGQAHLSSKGAGKSDEPAPLTGPGRGQAPPLPYTTGRGWLLALALYLVGILMAALGLAVVQSLQIWNQFFSSSFAPLGAPWYVLLYGLLGGCISCMMALGRAHRPTVPGFVMLTWFARPFLGMVLAALAYLVLTSGAFSMSIVPAQRYAICSVVGAMAGLCEGRLFFRRK